MRFNHNIYMRLYQIAFFMPDALRGKYDNGVESSFEVPYPNAIPVDDPILKDKIRSSILFTNFDRDFFYKSKAIDMGINHFERILFYVCINVYEQLQTLFSAYKKEFLSCNEMNNKKNNRLEDNPESFYNFIISRDAISEDMIKEKSFDLFHSLKTACYFYCKFTPCYRMYIFSGNIGRCEKTISILKYLKVNIAYYFSSFPYSKDTYIISDLSDLNDSLSVYFECSNAVEGKIKDEEEKQKWKVFLELLCDKIMLSCIEVSNRLSVKVKHSPTALVSRRIDKLVTKKEKKRRKRISDSQNNRLSERQEKVQRHVKNILMEWHNSKKKSMKTICEVYLDANRTELNSIGITSPRTLQNICSKTKPNKQRSAFFNRAYITPDYSKDCQEEIMKTYNLIESNALIPRNWTMENM